MRVFKEKKQQKKTTKKQKKKKQKKKKRHMQVQWKSEQVSDKTALHVFYFKDPTQTVRTSAQFE